MYRIKHAHHHRSGDKWCIYPSYDYTHGQSDSIEGITHSICTLEFENHRPLYDWFCDALGIHHPQQIEFARLNLTYTVMSKRKLLQLVQEKHVAGWDDPRMLTIRGLRRRGYTPEAMRAFCERIGVAKFNSTIDMAWLEDAIRDDLNERAPRVMAVLRPLKVVLTNYPEGQVEELEAANHPQKPEMGTRMVPFTRELYIEADDFMEDAPKKFFRLAPGREVRLRYAYFITCNEVVKDAAGNVTELRCTYDPATRGGNAPDGRKVKGTIHWVAAPTAVSCRDSPLRSPLQDRASGRCARKGKTVPRQHQSGLADDRRATRSSNRRWPTPNRASISNSSASATSSPTRSIRNRASRCSIARRRCAIPGRRKRRRIRRAVERVFEF